jgi:GUN4-like
MKNEMLRQMQKVGLVLGGLAILLGYIGWWHWQSLQVDYSKLDQLLSTRKWMEADIETSKIISKLLLKSVESQTFFGSSIFPLNGNKFRVLHGGNGGLPCRDLKILDQLWSKYSDGQFGFGVQTDIALSTPGFPDRINEVSNDFEQRVGWHWKYSNKPSSHPIWYYPAQNPKKAKGFLPSNLWALDVKIEKPVETPAVLQTLNHFRNCSTP